MNELLNEYYANLQKTASAPSTPEEAISAHAPYFTKVAELAGINPETLSATEFAQVWDYTVKAAAEGASPEQAAAKKDDEEDEARKEHAEKKAQVEKIAEWDMQGRVMADAFLDQLQKAASKGGNSPNAPVGQAARTFTIPKAPAGKVRELDVENAVNRAAAVRGKAETGGLSGALGRAKDTLKYHGGNAAEWVKKNPGKAGLAAGGAALLGGGAYLAGRKKESSAFDVEAAKLASAYATSAGWDAVDALNNVLAEGSLDSQNHLKIASADYDTGLRIRAHEYLEAVGIPVDWNQV